MTESPSPTQRAPKARRRTGAHSAPPRRRPPRPDERIAARRVSVAREAGRKRLRIAVAASGAVALAGGGFALAHSPLVAARSVTITGATHTTRAAILQASGLAAHPPLIDINSGADAQAIERLPWVERARVSVSFPSSVHVAITERVAVGAVRLGKARFALVDPTGHVLSDVGTDPVGLVTILGVASVPRPGRRLASFDEALTATAAAVPTGLVGRIAGIETTKRDGIVVVMRNAPFAILGSTANLHEKFVALATVLSGVVLSGVTSIDLRAPSNPVLTP